MSKTWLVNELTYDNGELIDSNPVEYTEEYILNYYWDYWKEEMIKKYGKDHKYITKENCLEDWVVVNWAWEKESE